MANDFKNSLSNNITTEAVVHTVTDTNPSVLLQLDIANLNTVSTTVTVKITDTSASTTVNLVKDAPIPIGSALQVINGQKLILEQSDTVSVSSTGGAVDVIASLLTDVVS